LGVAACLEIVLEDEGLDGVLLDGDAAVGVQLKDGAVALEELDQVLAREADDVAHLVGCA